MLSITSMAVNFPIGLLEWHFLLWCAHATHSAGQQAVLPVSEKVKITQMQPEGYHIGSDYEFVKRVL